MLKSEFLIKPIKNTFSFNIKKLGNSIYENNEPGDCDHNNQFYTIGLKVFFSFQLVKSPANENRVVEPSVGYLKGKKEICTEDTRFF